MVVLSLLSPLETPQVTDLETDLETGLPPKGLARGIPCSPVPLLGWGTPPFPQTPTKANPRQDGW